MKLIIIGVLIIIVISVLTGCTTEDKRIDNYIERSNKLLKDTCNYGNQCTITLNECMQQLNKCEGINKSVTIGMLPCDKL